MKRKNLPQPLKEVIRSLAITLGGKVAFTVIHGLAPRFNWRREATLLFTQSRVGGSNEQHLKDGVTALAIP